jgi:hypothetical protein
MKNRISSLFIIFFLFVFLLPAAGQAKNYVQYFSTGKIDWTNGVVEAIGLACPRDDRSNLAQARALANREAQDLAKGNLLNIIKEMRIDSENSIGHHMDRPNFPASDMTALLRRAAVVEKSLLENGCVKTTVAMSVAGSFADLVLPENILNIDTIQQPAQESRREDGFTGLVVDCRGLSVKPAMVPVILDEDGSVIYGSAYISREHAVRTGAASYLRDLVAAQRSARAAPRALTVKAIKVVKGRESDVVISNNDGANIRRNPTNLSFLHKGRVLFVLD